MFLYRVSEMFGTITNSLKLIFYIVPSFTVSVNNGIKLTRAHRN
jgi:hypothetical protein